MPIFADVYLEPGGIIGWLAVGLIAGFLAGKVMKGSGYGIVGDIIVGLIGAFLGGLLFGFDTAVIAGTTDALTRAYSLSPGGLGLTVANALICTRL